MRRRPQVFALVTAPLDTPVLSHRSNLTRAFRSLFGNVIGAEGASALAAILKETKITTLG